MAVLATTETDRCTVGSSVAAHRGGHAGLVALGVGQHPPRRRVRVDDQMAAGGDRSGSYTALACSRVAAALEQQIQAA
jgi:hypothetical protein